MRCLERAGMVFCILLVGFIAVVSNCVPEKEAPKKWIIEGYALTTAINMNDRQVPEEVLKGAAADLLEYTTVFLNHNDARPIGHVLATRVIEVKLWVKIEISKTEPDIWAKIKDGTLSKLSVQFRILDREFEYSDELERSFHLLTKIILVEVSVVSIPADRNAIILEWREE